jgi:hypothetical protein
VDWDRSAEIGSDSAVFRYATGDQTAMVSNKQSKTERHMGINRYGNEFHRFLVAVALARMGVKSGNIDLTVFAPPKLLKKENSIAAYVIDQFKQYPATISLKDDKTPRRFTYTDVTVMPEGVAALLAIMYDAEGNPTPLERDFLAGSCKVLDFGTWTFSVTETINGSLNLDDVGNYTFENYGLRAGFFTPMCEEIRSWGGAWEAITEDMLDIVIRHGLDSADPRNPDNWLLSNMAGQSHSILELYNIYSLRYAERLANEVLDNNIDILSSNKCFAVGGGDRIVVPHLSRFYGKNVFYEVRKHPTVKGIHPAYYNAIGGLRRRINRLKNQKKS